MSTSRATIHTETPASRRAAEGILGGRIKVLQLCAVDFTAYHFLLSLGRALREDYEVHFASSPGPYVERIREAGFVFHPISIKRSYDLLSHVRSIVSLRKLMIRERYHVVHTHTPVAALLGRIAARLSRVPIVLYTAHGFYFHDRMPRLKRSAFAFLEKVGSALTDFTFTQSGEDYEAAVSMGIAREDRLLHIGNGVDIERFNPVTLSGRRTAMRDALGLSPDQPVACIIGRLVREKGYFELIDAFSSVVREMPEARLIVVGGALESDHDDAEREILRRVSERALDGVIKFLSFRDDIEEILCASDVFVLPSLREGMPRSILEAMAMGLPVVATNIRGSREEVEDGLSGILVEVGDVGGLAAAIQSLLRDTEKRTRMGRRGREITEERFNEQMVVKKQADIVRQLLKERGFF